MAECDLTPPTREGCEHGRLIVARIALNALALTLVCGAAGRRQVPNGAETNTPPVRGPLLALDIDRRLGRLGDVVPQLRRLLPLRRHHLVLLHTYCAAPDMSRAPSHVATSDVRGRGVSPRTQGVDSRLAGVVFFMAVQTHQKTYFRRSALVQTRPVKCAEYRSVFVGRSCPPDATNPARRPGVGRNSFFFVMPIQGDISPLAGLTVSTVDHRRNEREQRLEKLV